MRKLIGIFITIITVMAFISCDPVENRLEFDKGLKPVTDAEIGQYIKIEQEIREGKKSNYFKFSSDGLKALTTFQYGTGKTIGAGVGSYIQCFIVSGEQEFIVTARNTDGTELVKKFNVTIEECFNVAPEWALFCGTGSKVWTWNESLGSGMHGMGDVNDAQAGWWCPTPQERVAGEGVGATMTFYAAGSALVKKRTDGSTESGSFSFDMKTTPGFKNSLGQFSTSGVTILAGRNTKGGEFETKFHIMRLDAKELRLLVIDMDGRDSYKPDSEGWGQATHWCFKSGD